MNNEQKLSQLKFINGSYLLKDNLPSYSYGVSIFDIDSDDEPEILVANSNSENIIYKYCDESNEFKNITPDNFKLKNYQTISLCIGDFLGNGVPAVYMLHSDTFGGLKNIYDHLFVRTSADKVTPNFNDLFIKQSSVNNPYAGRSVGAVDFSGNGQYGFYVVNYDAPSLFYIYNIQTEQIEEKSQELGLRQFAGGRGFLAQYLVNEKASDIFIGNENCANSFFTKNQDGSRYEECSHKFNLCDNFGNARGLGVADFTGNGLADIVVGNWHGLNSIYMQENKGSFTERAPAVFREPMAVRNIIVADFDNDGREEVFVNNFDEPCQMFRYLGTNEWEELDIGELALEESNCTGAAVGDLTGNGFLDIFISTGEAAKQPNQLFLGIDNGNSWLRIQPLTQQGFPALSAKVRLVCHDAPSQTKFICSGSGYICQMEPVAHFGLGKGTPKIDFVEITWPGDGVNPPPSCVVPGRNLSLNSFVKIPHPQTKAKK